MANILPISSISILELTDPLLDSDRQYPSSSISSSSTTNSLSSLSLPYQFRHRTPSSSSSSSSRQFRKHVHDAKINLKDMEYILTLKTRKQLNMDVLSKGSKENFYLKKKKVSWKRGSQANLKTDSERLDHDHRHSHGHYRSANDNHNGNDDDTYRTVADPFQFDMNDTFLTLSPINPSPPFQFKIQDKNIFSSHPSHWIFKVWSGIFTIIRPQILTNTKQELQEEKMNILVNGGEEEDKDIDSTYDYWNISSPPVPFAFKFFHDHSQEFHLNSSIDHHGKNKIGVILLTMLSLSWMIVAVFISIWVHVSIQQENEFRTGVLKD